MARTALRFSERHVNAAGWAIIGVLAAARVIAVYTEAINWDEFALLDRVLTSIREGTIDGGGRPGLGTLIMMPLVAGCRDAVAALVGARIVWQGIMIAAAAALFLLLRAAIPESPYRNAALLAALALWLLAPPVFRFSLQVRTDQPAILLGLLGGIPLIASLRRPWWAFLAGALFGVGFLFSQKLIYVAALAALLAVGHGLRASRWSLRRDLVRAALTLLGFMLAIVIYRETVAAWIGTSQPIPVARAASDFAHYRDLVGWYWYLQLLPALLPHLLVMSLLMYLTVDWLELRGAHGRELLLAWAVAGLGAAVMVFHAARFPYFLMILCLFPAVVAALILPIAATRWQRSSARLAGVLAVAVPLLALAVREAGLLLTDTQRVQRASFAFIERNFLDTAAGFQAHGALACRGAAHRFPVQFRSSIVARFYGEGAEETVRTFLDDFRRHQVAFLLPPFTYYPESVSEFWMTRYVPYRESVWVAGTRVLGADGRTLEFEAVVAGRFTWHPQAGSAAILEVDGAPVTPGSSIRLTRGVHELRLRQGAAGIFALALADPPRPGRAQFYRAFWREGPPL